jgi:ribosomal-protein-alanine N-acetyltransferase
MASPVPPRFPALTTARLNLREVTDEDARSFHDLLSISEVVRAIHFNYFIPSWKCAGLGYEAHPRFWGRGLMTEAVRAIVACGHGRFALNRIEAWTLEGNRASDRVLQKCGFRFEGIQRQKGWFKDAFHDFRLFGRIAADPGEG